LITCSIAKWRKHSEKFNQISVVRVGNPCAWELSQPNKYLAMPQNNFPKFENTGFHGQLMQDNVMAAIRGEDSQYTGTVAT